MNNTNQARNRAIRNFIESYHSEAPATTTEVVKEEESETTDTNESPLHVHSPEFLRQT